MHRFFKYIIIATLLCHPTKSFAEDTSLPFMAEQVFADAFSSISQKYIKEVDLKSFVIDGLSGLKEIDGALNIIPEENRISIYYNTSLIATYTEESKANIAGWAKLVSRSIGAIRSKSRSIRLIPLDDLYSGFFNSALQKLDSHSKYASAQNAVENRASRNGFGGLGIRYRRASDYIEISRIIPGMPAEQKGLQVGDRILEIDGHKISLMTRNDVINNLRGIVNSTAELLVQNKDTKYPYIVKLHRSLVIPETVESNYSNGILTLRIFSFNQNTSESVRKSLVDTMNNNELNGTIIDLRGNPGGLLDEAVETANIFMNDGLIVSTRGRHEDSIQFFNASEGDTTNGKPIVVLIDDQSASAAEILASALQDQERAIVMGTSSYGKGTVQTVLELSNKAEITLTWALFIAPSGYSIEKLGVTPTICLTESNEKIEKPSKIHEFLQNQTDESDKISDRISFWRRIDHDNPEMVETARSLCEPRKINNNNNILLLSEQILSDATIYNNLVKVSSQANKKFMTQD